LASRNDDRAHQAVLRVFKNFVAQPYEGNPVLLTLSAAFPQRLVFDEQSPSKAGLDWAEVPSNGYELSSILAR
jgi:hypothetical protein